MPGTEPIAREEFKSVFNHALFLASFEPVITPRQINNELVKMLEKARDLDNILFWNYILIRCYIRGSSTVECSVMPKICD